ncbi:MAG TPA: Wzz/FepE/Etk N-terminal domain-containing protein, partial [Clostridia bacterium]|nr:Wzz/FepE/Etk N-terminal domain-containing protein [Clostridia bacterium]
SPALGEVDKKLGQPHEISLKEILAVLRRYFLMIVSVTIICTVTGFFVTKYVVHPVFEADALLIVNAAAKSDSSGSAASDIALSQSLVDTYAVIMKNDTVLDHVISNLGLSMDSAALYNNIIISQVGTTEVMKLQVKNKDPALALKIAQAIIDYAPGEIVRTVKVGSVKIITPAALAKNPVGPNLSFNTAVAAGVGLGASVIFSLLLDLFNNKFKTEDDVRRMTGMIILGAIPKVNKNNTGS